MDGSEDAIGVERFGGSALIRFTRPEARNPLSVNTLQLLSAQFELLESDPATETIIFAGSGNTFASGADLREVARLDAQSARDFGERGQGLMRRIFESEKRTIAAIDGFCMGGALDLAVACGKRIASGRSRFAHPGVRLGIITGWGGTQLLPGLVGRKNAFLMLLTGKTIGAYEALEMGLINEIADDPVQTALSSLKQVT